MENKRHTLGFSFFLIYEYIYKKLILSKIMENVPVEN